MEAEAVKQDLVELRKNKNASLKESGVNLYPNDFRVEHTVSEIRNACETSPESLGEEGQVFKAAGRMMAMNFFGKSAFIRFKDRTGTMQVYIQKNKVGDECYSLFKQLDIGDFAGFAGPVFQTKTGEWTLLATEFKLVSKSVRALPEKFHGLKDPEKRYRQRYLDLIMNQDARQIFLRRSQTVQAIRNFLIERDFLEVETPMMQPIPGGAEATPFVTHHNALGMDLYLRIAPELYLKRLVVGGFERVFEINRNFRNEGISTRHNPEFTMLEFYQAYATYEDLMNITEQMFQDVAQKVTGDVKVEYQGNTIDFSSPWRRIPLLDSLVEIAGVDRNILTDKEALLKFAAEKEVKITKADRLGKVITKLFETLVEPLLIHPTFITGYPVEVSPLSRRSDEKPELTERFELFIAGREIANGFSELNDPDDQRDRFLQQVADKAAGDSEAHPMDEDYIEALEYGMPPTAGEGIGIDRLAMLLTDSPSIREVILFPHMRRVADK
ncbi:lysine--tRNA ligase [Desulforegula conservatrix]|uniref:lysine--tRNA ligase n=1 Tax=Desulforegula conservatrix TaxID=153026 RepID=UPI0003FD83F6|nr:lysine--tRNA ligase [Desulforegula conservatrix]